MKITDIAREELINHDGDKRLAVAAVVQRLDAEERKRIADEALQAAAWNALGAVSRGLRARFFEPATHPQKPGGDAVFRSIAYANWYNCPLPQGILLGNATKSDVAEARDYWIMNAETNQRRAEWAGKLLERLKGNKAVRDQLTEEQLQGIAGDMSLAVVA